MLDCPKTPRAIGSLSATKSCTIHTPPELAMVRLSGGASSPAWLFAGAQFHQGMYMGASKNVPCPVKFSARLARYRPHSILFLAGGGDPALVCFLVGWLGALKIVNSNSLCILLASFERCFCDCSLRIHALLSNAQGLRRLAQCNDPCHAAFTKGHVRMVPSGGRGICVEKCRKAPEAPRPSPRMSYGSTLFLLMPK